MKRNSRNTNKTNPLLLKAQCMLSSYKKSTGAVTCITDHNHLTIPEIFDEITNDKITCLYCIKHQMNIQVNKSEDLIHNPCKALHVNNMKEAFTAGESSCYKCDLGFMFWTSPVFSGKNYIGSLTGSGFICGDKNETAEKMEILSKGEVKKQELLKYLSKFPETNKQHVKAMSELLLVCAESVSHDSSYQETLKRRNRQQEKITKVPENNQTAMLAPPAIPTTEAAPVIPAQTTKAPIYPTEKEKAFLKAVNSGSTEKSVKLLYELLDSILLMYPGDFRKIQYRVMELSIILSRTDNAYNILSDKNHQFIKSIEEAKNLEELVDNVHLMTEHMTNDAFAFKGIRHVSALKKADRFIQSNFTRKISLEDIAAAAGLSSPYFSTVFR